MRRCSYTLLRAVVKSALKAFAEGLLWCRDIADCLLACQQRPVRHCAALGVHQRNGDGFNDAGITLHRERLHEDKRTSEGSRCRILVPGREITIDIACEIHTLGSRIGFQVESKSHGSDTSKIRIPGYAD